MADKIFSKAFSVLCEGVLRLPIFWIYLFGHIQRGFWLFLDLVWCGDVLAAHLYILNLQTLPSGALMSWMIWQEDSSESLLEVF